MVVWPRLKVGAAKVSTTAVPPPVSVRLPPVNVAGRVEPRRLETTVPLLSRKTLPPGLRVSAPAPPRTPEPPTVREPPETVSAPTKLAFPDCRVSAPLPSWVMLAGGVAVSVPVKLRVPAPANVSACAPVSEPLKVRLAPASAPMTVADASVTVPETVLAPETACKAPP